MTEQKNSSEKTEKTDRNEKPASAPKKPSIEPKSARGVSTTARRKTAKEADAALQDKIEKARAGAMPERREPAAAGESAGLPPVQTVRAMPQINRKKDETMSDEKAAAPAKKTDKSQKAAAKKPSAPIKMPERDATGRFLPSEEKSKKPRAKARAQQARTEDVKKPSEMPEAKPAQKTQEAKAAKKPEGPVTSAAPAAPVPHVKPVLSLLMDEAPSGVMTDMKADDRPAPGEVRGNPRTKRTKRHLRLSSDLPAIGPRTIPESSTSTAKKTKRRTTTTFPTRRSRFVNRPTTMRSMMTSLTTMTISLLPTGP